LVNATYKTEDEKELIIMMSNEEYFSDCKGILLFSEALTLFELIEKNKIPMDSDFMELYSAFIKSAVDYAHIRSEWYLMDKAEKVQKDSFRTSLHNSFIDSCNILSRYMSKENLDSSWRERLGNDRKRIGDFACYISAILGIKSR
jgi:hypothetical protein